MNSIPRRDFLGSAGALLAATAFPSPSASLSSRGGPQPLGHALRVQRLAWAGLRIDCGDSTVFVDATHPDADEGLADAPITTEAKYPFGLITHHHSDHYSPDALKSGIGEQGIVLTHKDVARWMDTRAFRFHTVELHQPAYLPTFGDTIVVTAVPASDGFGHPQVSWVIQANGKKIFHGGDTLWHGHWWDIAVTHGPFDAVFLPINGFRMLKGRFVNSDISMSLTPEQAASAAWILGARLALPMHYGTTGDPAYIEVTNAEPRFLKAAEDHNVKARVLKVGDWLEL